MEVNWNVSLSKIGESYIGESYWNFEWLNNENCRQEEKHKRHNGKPVDVRH